MSHFLAEINEQPQTLRSTTNSIRAAESSLLAWIDGLKSRPIKRVIFTGMGASYYAPIPAMLYLIEQGMDAIIIDTSELLYYQMPLFNEQTLLVAISQSGRSVEVVRLVEQLKGKNIPVLGITNDPASPLAQNSDLVLALEAGQELTVSNKTYTSTLAALHLLACALSGQPLAPAYDALEQAASLVGEYLPTWNQQAQEVANTLAGVQSLILLGRGPALASAMNSALIIKESAKFPTEGMSGGQFRHGPLEVVDSRIAILMFTGAAPVRQFNLDLAAEIAKLGGRMTLIGATDNPYPQAVLIPLPTADPWLMPIFEIIPMQYLAVHFAAAQGLEAGKFRYIQKVTTKE